MLLKTRPFTEVEADEVYTILASTCGAPESFRSAFAHHFTEADWPNEWRFGGHLGMGGKFYRDDERLRVGCYREDETDDRREMIEKANAQLERYAKEHLI